MDGLTILSATCADIGAITEIHNEAVLEEARRAGLHDVIARIVGGNEVSIYLREAAGFEHAGLLREAGFKFGRLLDVVIMQKIY